MAVRPRRWLRRLAYVLTAILALLSVLAAYVLFAPIPTCTAMQVELSGVPSPDRLARGREIASVLCTQCHLDPATRKLSGRLTPKTPLGQNWSSNITSDAQHGLGGWSDGQIAYALRTGVKPEKVSHMLKDLSIFASSVVPSPA